MILLGNAEGAVNSFFLLDSGRLQVCVKKPRDYGSLSVSGEMTTCRCAGTSAVLLAAHRVSAQSTEGLETKGCCHLQAGGMCTVA